MGRPVDALPHARAALDVVQRMGLSDVAFNGLGRKCAVRLAVVEGILAAPLATDG
jgi:hypothetical protein